ncbi:MAG: hypothetical protein NW201_07910 [Gemmatimonadales bacterium]|nr:hypothetical protein [Gemmatimonadales bacterium]
MSKRQDAMISKLIKANAKKVVKPKDELRRQYDDTLPQRTEEGKDAKAIFKEMKKREF